MKVSSWAFKLKDHNTIKRVDFYFIHLVFSFHYVSILAKKKDVLLRIKV
jgi:hypothetical protein